MFICRVCDKEFHNQRGISTHIASHGKTKQEYYDEYIKKAGEGVCYCGNNTNFRSNKYLKFCSNKCYAKYGETRRQRSKRLSGKKQSSDHVEKRIQNTDQTKKETTRYNTMMLKYGTLSYSPLTGEESRARKISAKLSGRKHSIDHHEKIIDAKRKNNTLKHTAETKEKIKNSVLAVYRSDDPPITISTGSPKGYKTGYFMDIFYRSSYELRFLEYCHRNNIMVESAATKEFRVKYFDKENNKFRMYYPDFYLPEYGVIIEIKPISMIDDLVIEKASEIVKKQPFLLLTEEELQNLDEIFKYM